MKLGRVLGIALFWSWFLGSRGQFFFFPDLLSVVYDEGLNTDEWANWSFDFQGAGGFFFVNFHSFKAIDGPFGIDICLGGFDGFKVAFMNGTFPFNEGNLHFSILDEGHFLPDSTIVDVFSNEYDFNVPGPLMDAPVPHVWTTYSVPIGPLDGQSILFYNQSPHTNCFVLDEISVFDVGIPSPPSPPLPPPPPPSPPSPPPPPPPPPIETLVFDDEEGGLQEDFTFEAFGIFDGISDGFDDDGGTVVLGPFGLLNIFRSDFHDLAVGPAIININIVQVDTTTLPDNIDPSDTLTIDISLFNFASFGPSTLIDTVSLVDLPLTNLPQMVSFEIKSPTFAVDGINFKSQASSGAQEFQIELIVVLENPF